VKSRVQYLLLVSAFIAGLGFMPTGRLTAQSFKTLHSFSGNPSDGAEPSAGLILSGNILYGTTFEGGNANWGTVFAVNTDGTGFSILHNFSAPNPNAGDINYDGFYPDAGLILSGNNLFGTAANGGSFDSGTVFAVNTNGTSFTNLHSFTATSVTTPYTNSDGSMPEDSLILSGNMLYGTARFGGSGGSGTVFTINTNGTGFTNLYSFTALVSGNNIDGASPVELILSGNTLYGTAYTGGVSGSGAVFALSTNGTGFTNLYSFKALASGTNSDGANPVGLILSGNILYGMAKLGGSGGSGTVFAVKTNGSGFTNLHSFSALVSGTNSDGANPVRELILSGNTLYGAAIGGGSSGNGTIFALNTDGTGFTNLYIFTETPAMPNSPTNYDGAFPNGSLILSGNTLYGTAAGGGSGDSGYGGTVFALSLVPSLGIAAIGNQIVLSWPTWVPNYQLQTTTNPVSQSVWNTNLPSPIVVNGQNVVTNPISGIQQFYRLSHP
jgi:uncharacterized repeat protein (TIGR03803 family)